MQHIVLFDPKNVYWPGALVDEAMARKLAATGCSCIPVNLELRQRNAVSGFHEQRWGGGIALSPATPQRLSAMLLYVAPGYPYINWRARLQATGEAPVGNVRIIGDGSQVGTGGGGFTALDQEAAVRLDNLGNPDAAGGWNIGGRARLSTVVDGYLGLCMYGAGRGARLLFSAVSQTE